MILSDEKYVLLCVDNPMSAHFLLFFFQALPSSITAKERSFSRIDIDCPLEERLGQVESTTSVLQLQYLNILHSGEQGLWGLQYYTISH
jgi:hypothetical protein